MDSIVMKHLSSSGMPGPPSRLITPMAGLLGCTDANDVSANDRLGGRCFGRPVRSRLVVALSLAGTLALSACGGNRGYDAIRPSVTTTVTAPPSTDPTSAPLRTQSTAPPTTVSSGGTPGPPSSEPSMCSVTQLTATITPIQGGAGHQGSIIRFQNGASPCLLDGYPGLDGVSDNGEVVVHAQRTPRGYLGGLPQGADEPHVTLASQQTASALVEGLGGPVTGGPPCPSYAALLVTPPNETHSIRIPSDYSLCYIEIHPVMPGMTGGATVP